MTNEEFTLLRKNAHTGLARHRKTGGLYLLVGPATMQHDGWMDMKDMVVYRSVETAALWVRPKDEFLERFDLHRP